MINYKYRSIVGKVPRGIKKDQRELRGLLEGMVGQEIGQRDLIETRAVN